VEPEGGNWALAEGLTALKHFIARNHATWRGLLLAIQKWLRVVFSE
jgi:hypothetical protein